MPDTQGFSNGLARVPPKLPPKHAKTTQTSERGKNNQDCDGFLQRNTVRKYNRNHPGGNVFDFCKKTYGEAGVEVGCNPFDFVLD